MFRFINQDSVNYESNRMVRPDSPESEATLNSYYQKLGYSRSRRASMLRDANELELKAYINQEEMKAIRLEQDKENDEEDQAFSAGVLAEPLSDESDLRSLFFKADKSIQDEIVREYMAKNSVRATKAQSARVEKLVMTNGRQTITWWKLPRNRGYDYGYEQFLRNISKDALAEMVTDVCRDLELGVTYFSRLLCAINREAWGKGVSHESGMLISDTLMSPEKTYAAQIKTNSTDRQRIAWAAILKQHFKVPVSSK